MTYIIHECLLQIFELAMTYVIHECLVQIFEPAIAHWCCEGIAMHRFVYKA